MKDSFVARFFIIVGIVSVVQSDTWTVLKKFDLSNMQQVLYYNSTSWENVTKFKFQIRNDWNIIKWLPGNVNNEMENYVDSSENIYIDQGTLVIKAVNKTRPCKMQYNKDIQGNDLHSVSYQPASACCDICRKYPGCKTFSWNDFQGGTCWLKGGFWPVVPRSNVQIGYLCDMTSGRLESKQFFSPVKSPGRKLRVEYVAKVPTVMGAWPALWMLGRSGVYGNWPQEGEMDIMEWVWQIRGNSAASLHWKGGEDWTYHFNQLNMQQLASEWTTFGLEYSAVANQEYVKFYMKTQLGVTYYSTTQTPNSWRYTWHPNPPCTAIIAGGSKCTPLAPFDNDMMLIMNFAVGGVWGGCCGVWNYNAFNNGGVPFYIKSAAIYHN